MVLSFDQEARILLKKLSTRLAKKWQKPYCEVEDISMLV
jgi:hypothetical protein